jgi:hypothetical protein
VNKPAGLLRTLAAAALLGPVLACAADDPMAQVPGVGDYDASLCVTVGQAPPNCGPAVVSWAGGIARVRLGDFAYVLWLYPRRIEVALMQGEMQVQEFKATWQWQGRDRLLFKDDGRNTRYELRLGAMK